MIFKACAVTTWLSSCCSQLQEQSHSRQAKLTLLLHLHGRVCSTLWKVQKCLFPLILTPESSKCSRTGMWGGLVLPHVRFVIEFISVVRLLLWIHAAFKQVAKYQQDEFSPPPIPTTKPHRAGQGQQQSKQMFYICCAFWVWAVLFFPLSFTSIVLL